MKKVILALVFGAQLEAAGIHGWAYAGPMGKDIAFHDKEFLLNNGDTPEVDTNAINLHTIGGYVGGGILLPLPVFVGAEGGWSHVHNSFFDQSKIVGGEFVSQPRIGLQGSAYSFEAYAGYLFQPLCAVPWSLYPLFTYSSDTFVVSIPTFPLNLPPTITLDKLSIRQHLSFCGPGIGFGTNYSYYGFLLSGDFSWQFRRIKFSGTTVIEVGVPGSFALLSKQHSSAITWLQGPKCVLSLDYIYCGWFVGISGEWKHLWQLGGSEGAQGEIDYTLDGAGDLIALDAFETPMTINQGRWTEWTWKASLGFAF